MSTDKIAESPDEQALRIRKEMNAIPMLFALDHPAWCIEFARRLRAEWGKGQEPVAEVRETKHASGGTTIEIWPLVPWVQIPEGTKFYASPIAQAPVAQDGMVMVPREPTDDQVAEGEILLRCMIEARTSLDVRLIYSAMLAASPSPTTPDQDAVEARRYPIPDFLRKHHG